METDRHGREVRTDRLGLRYVVTDEGMFYITHCCDASAKGSMGVTVCRVCYEEIDPMLGGIPEPLGD